MTALRGLLILLICLIILPVLVYSNHFSQETFATANTEEDAGGTGGDSGGFAVPPRAVPSSPSDLDEGSEGSAPSDLDEGSEGSAGDDDNDDKFRHNAEDIAMEVSSLPPEEIREYPITDLSDNDIILVFGFLNPGNLTKLLLNIPQEDLADIRDRLTPVTFTESLSRISEVDRSQVENRLVLATTVN